MASDGLHRDEKVQLMKLVAELYSQFKITKNSNFSRLKASQYPIMQDLYKLALNHYEETEQLIFKDLSLILARFADGGIDSKLWNGYSTINQDNNLLIVFDLYTLTESGNKRVINSQIFLILKYIEAEIRRNKNYNDKHPKEQKWIVITIDEANLLIDKKYPAALYFMVSMIKRIRKYNGIMNIISQNINDFVGDQEVLRETTAIINGVQYLKCFNLTPLDLKALETLYASYGGITQIEKHSISRFNVGECLFSLGGHYRIETNIEILENERKIF